MKQRFLIVLAILIVLAAASSIIISEFSVRKNAEKLMLERARDRLAIIVWGYGVTSSNIDVYSYIEFDNEVFAVRKDKILIFQYGTARLDLGAPTTRVLSTRTGSYEFVLYVDINKAMAKYYDLVRTTIQVTTLMFTFFFGVFGWLLVSAVSNPISRLAATMVTITSRNLRVRMPVPKRKDEVQQLILTFNSMLDEIGVTYERQVRFVEDMTHDILTPVQILEGFRQLIERHGRTDELVDEYLEVSKVELGRLRDMSGALKNAMAAEKRRAVGFVNASKLTETLIKAYAELHPKLRFESFLEKDLMLKIDPTDLERIEHILLENAVKYGREGGVVTVSLHENRLSVKDNGCGIDPKERGLVFERYYQTDEAERKGDGSGLGLAILKKFSQEYGFHIHLDSRIGEGCTFTLDFSSTRL